MLEKPPKLVVQYAFNRLGLIRLVAIIEAKNYRSLAVAQNLEMAYEKDTLYKGIPVQFYKLDRPQQQGMSFP